MSGTSSGLIVLDPPAVMLGGMGCTDVDGAWLIDATGNMQSRGTTIASVGTPVVARADGSALGSGDVTVSGQTVAAGGYKWTFRATGHGNVATYLAGFPLTLADGDTITRWVQFDTLPTPG